MIVTGDSDAKFRRGWAGWPKRLRISSASASTHASYDACVEALAELIRSRFGSVLSDS